MTSNPTSGKAGSINRLSLNECDGDVVDDGGAGGDDGDGGDGTE